jgi:tetratricopeptide (TPR) repeat protein
VAAVIRVLESWLYFQKGRHKEALKILTEAESVLGCADDPVVLGNIQSTYGRIYRHQGRYDRAIHHFTDAIEHYRQVDPRHPHLARTLANMAYVERLVALELRHKIDADVARRKQAGSRSGDPTRSEQARYREEFARVRDAAFGHLDEAAEICKAHPSHRSAGTLHLNRGLLHLDNGGLDLAEEEAGRAFALAEEKQDLILMSRARVLQCMIENAKLDEGIQEDPRRHAHAALDYILDAISFARGTQNRRLLARAHTWHGLTLCNDFFRSHDAAIEAMNSARAYLDHGFHDTAWEDFQRLRESVIKTHTVDETLHAWSQGAVGNKTFREISEQFAEIVIPKVWELEGRKIARVASRLAISPKKVRRALSRAGLLRQGTRSDAAAG